MDPVSHDFQRLQGWYEVTERIDESLGVFVPDEHRVVVQVLPSTLPAHREICVAAAPKSPELAAGPTEPQRASHYFPRENSCVVPSDKSWLASEIKPTGKYAEQ